MSESTDSPFQSLLRLGVMGSALFVGVSAYRAYGPPVEELPPLLNQLAARAKEAWVVPHAAGPQPAAASVAAAPPQLADLQPLVPGELQPANPTSWDMAPLRRADATHRPPLGRGLLVTGPTRANLQTLYAELKELGAEDLSLAAWGADGTLHRFACCAPVSGSAGFVRHFDAVESSPEMAIARVCQDLKTWRAQAGTLR